MRILVDTNILVALHDPPRRDEAQEAVDRLQGSGVELCVFSQNLRELRTTATRSREKNGLGMSQETADLAIAAVRGQFTVVSVPDEETQRHWERMVSGGNVVGNEHHDAYLAAGMVSQGISQILTSNAKHFHFPHVTALAPDTVNRREYVSSWHPPSGHLSQNQRAPTLHADATQSRGLGGPMKSAPQAVSASQSQSTVAPARQPSPAEPPPAVKEAKHQERESSSLHAQRQRDEQTQKAAQAQARQAEAHSRGGRSR